MRVTSLLLLLPALTASVTLCACRSQPSEPEMHTTASPSHTSAASTAAGASPSGAQVAPAQRPPGWDDPPAAAWDFAPGAAPWAGLRVRQSGATLEQAQRIVVLFHGYGADGEDLMSLGRVLEAGPQTAWLFPEAPVQLERGGYAWFRRDRSNFAAAVERAGLLLRQLSEAHPGVPLIVGGFSQGAMLTANLVERAPANLRAALIFSPAELLLSPLSGTRRDVAVFLSHGTVDPVLPFEGGVALRDRFVAAGYDVDFRSFEGRHTIGRPLLMPINAFLGRLQP